MKRDNQESEKGELRYTRSGSLLSKDSKRTVAGLERSLLSRYPKKYAEPWDRTGLIVGDPHERIRAVAVALDPSIEAIQEAADIGANVLVTHHPPFIEAPENFTPPAYNRVSSGGLIWTAIQKGISIMSFHTTLDVSHEAAQVLPGMLRLPLEGILDIVHEDEGLGYGQICRVDNSEDDPLTLGRLAARCVSVFGRYPRVWGDSEQVLEKIVTATGSCGSLVEKALIQHVDVLVGGEIKYHDALAASQAGLCIIDLGHDVSELPLAALLATAVEAADIPKARIALLDQRSNWYCPETTRV